MAEMEAVFFVVERGPAGDRPAVYHERLPERLAPIYTVRLDRLPDPEKWLAMPIARLYALYVAMRDKGTLPQNMGEPPRAAAEPTKRMLGQYWEPPPATWRTDQPFVLPPVGRLRREAPAFIGERNDPAAIAKSEDTGIYLHLRNRSAPHGQDLPVERDNPNNQSDENS